MTAALQSELQAAEPTLNELARELGQAPEEVLRDAIAAKKKEWAHQKLDEAIAEADQGEFTPLVPGQLVNEVKERVAERRSESLT